MWPFRLCSRATAARGRDTATMDNDIDRDACLNIFDIFLIIFFAIGAFVPARTIILAVPPCRKALGVPDAFPTTPMAHTVMHLVSFTLWNGILLFAFPDVWCAAPFIGYPLGIAAACYQVHGLQRWTAPMDYPSAMTPAGVHFPSASPPPPPSYGDVPPPAASSSGWVRYEAPEDGKPYWHNSATGETTWEKPS